MMLRSGLLACGSGPIVLIWGIANGGAPIAASLLLGPLMFASGVLTLKITKRGRAWWGIPAREKALAIPGMIVGGGFGLTRAAPGHPARLRVHGAVLQRLGDVKSTTRAGL